MVCQCSCQNCLTPTLSAVFGSRSHYLKRERRMLWWDSPTNGHWEFTCPCVVCSQCPRKVVVRCFAVALLEAKIVLRVSSTHPPAAARLEMTTNLMCEGRSRGCKGCCCLHLLSRATDRRWPSSSGWTTCARRLWRAPYVLVCVCTAAIQRARPRGQLYLGKLPIVVHMQ